MTKLLAIDLAPYEHSTRTRKIAQLTAEAGVETIAITLSRVGRSGMIGSSRDEHIDSVLSLKIKTRKPREGASLAAQIVNLVGTYAWPVGTLLRKTLATPADTVLVGHISLGFIGLLHHRRYGSQVLLNGRERPGGVRTAGSLASLFSRIEPLVVRRLAASRWIRVVAVCESHATDFRSLGARTFVARNAPPASFRRPFAPPPSSNDHLIVGCLGTLYPGRGVETLIEAVGMARDSGINVQLEIAGRASAEFMSQLEDVALSTGHLDAITFHGPWPSDEVPSFYQMVHVGTALYENVDAANDSLSNKIFECVVSGRPVIASDLSENRRFVQENEVGWLTDVAAGDLADLLRAIYEMRSNLSTLSRRVFERSATMTWENECRETIAWIVQSKIENRDAKL